MEAFTNVVNAIDSAIWGIPMIILLFGTPSVLDRTHGLYSEKNLHRH